MSILISKWTNPLKDFFFCFTAPKTCKEIWYFCVATLTHVSTLLLLENRAITKSMAISQATLLISSKHDLLFIAPECLQGSGAVWWISVRQQPIISSMSYWILQECTQFSLSRRPGTRGQFQRGRHNGMGKFDRISLYQNYISVRWRRPLCKPLMDCSFFSRWRNGKSMTSWLRGQRLRIQWALMTVWEVSSLWSVPEPLVMRKINFDCCSWWSMRLRAI